MKTTGDLFLDYDNQNELNDNLINDDDYKEELDIVELLSLSDDNEEQYIPINDNKIYKYDGLQSYIKSIRDIPQCNPKESIQLAFEAQNGSLSAKNRLIEGNLRFVLHIAFKFQMLSDNIELQDLISEGAIGLAKATMKYAPKHGASFASYASFWIRQQLHRFISNFKRTVRIPVQADDKINKIKYYNEQLSKGIKIDDCLDEKEDFSDRNLNYFSSVLSEGYYLNSLYTLNSQTFPIINYLKEFHIDNNTPLDICCQKESYTIDDILNYGKLSEREKIIMEMRYGLKNDKPATLEEISVVVDKTRERVRQIGSATFSKIVFNMMQDKAQMLVGKENKQELVDYINNQKINSYIKHKNTLYIEAEMQLRDILFNTPCFDTFIPYLDKIEINDLSDSELFHKTIDILELNSFLTKEEIIEELAFIYPKLKIDFDSIKKILRSPLIEKQNSLFYLRTMQKNKFYKKEYSDEDILDDMFNLKDKMDEDKELDLIIQPIKSRKQEVELDVDNDLLDLFFDNEKQEEQENSSDELLEMFLI